MREILTRRAFLVLGLGSAVAILLLKRPRVKDLPAAPGGELDLIYANLVGGGPPKDGIPAIDGPRYIPAGAAGFLKDGDVVFGTLLEGPKAYPRKILYWHEVVNEAVGGEGYSVTYCPLTGSVIGYKGNFGVSGKLYNSNLVLYDRETESLWPQILGRAVHGPRKGERLEAFPVVSTTWGRWREKYPDTLVLSRETGFRRDYERNPYPGYEELLRIWFPVAASSDRFPSKKVVAGLENRGAYLAVPKDEFRAAGEAVYSLGGEEMVLRYDGALDTISARRRDGSPIQGFEVYWFAWYAYHPGTEIWVKE